MRVNYAIIFVRDMQRSIEFYRKMFDVSLRFESSHWSEFVTDGATLALHLAEDADAPGGGAGAGGATSDASSVAAPEQPGQCRPGFRVKDLDACHQLMAESGVVCKQAPTVRFGARTAQYVDPDGLVISVSAET